jgi:hypothetical protein
MTEKDQIDQIDVTNENQEYWERILAESDLSIKDEVETVEISAEEFRELTNLELLPEENYEIQDDPIVNFNSITKDTNTLNADHSGLSHTNDELRTKIDSADIFFTGHRIIKQRRGNRPVPSWATDNIQLRGLLLRAFPKLADNPKHRLAAGRWARVVQLYFRSQLTEGQVADELKMTVNGVKSIIRSILRTSRGRRANGTGVRTR